MRPALLLPVLLLLACSGDPLLDRVASSRVSVGELELTAIYALPPFTDAPMPVYFQVTNRGVFPDTMVAATSPITGMAMLHGGSMDHRMAVVIPAGETVTLEPGGLHVMLEPPLTVRPVRGDSAAVTLRFARAGSVTVQVPVIGYDETDAVRR
jgi:copper(I)-binding protein